MTSISQSLSLDDSLVDVFTRQARLHSDRAAIVQGDSMISHAAFHAAVARQAAALAAAGLQRGDRIVVLTGNRAEVLVLLGAAAWLGAVLVPINLRLAAAELAQQVGDAHARVLVMELEHESALDAALPDGMPGVVRLSLGPSQPDGAVLAEAGPVGFGPVPPPTGRASDAVLMLYTAAVDGRARGAVLSQRNLLASAAQLVQVWQLGPNDRWLGVLPFFHVAGIGLALAVQAAGGASVLLPRFDAAEAVRAIDAHGVSLCATFAPMLGAMLDAAPADASTPAALTSLRVLTGLEPSDVIARLAKRCPRAEFWSGYGQAEVSTMACLGRPHERPGAAGRAAPLTEIAVFDATDCTVKPSGVGEIAVRGPTVFVGYWDPVEQRAVPTTTASDGWHRTGDLGRLDAEGWLWFMGRSPHKQLIKTGGENVYPAEVEQALLAHPAVAEAFVFGRADPQWGEAVHAACVLKGGTVADEAELIAFVGGRLARFKRPKSVVFLTGSIDRAALPQINP
jgi:acyl-CoA synthetase (AMP-forming)/AMP-acid ligase II